MLASDITIVGTSHRFQVPGKPGSADFENELGLVLKAHSFAAIAEEMSLAALMEKGATESVCKLGARCMKRRAVAFVRKANGP